MTLATFVSGKGAPGVTSTVVGLALQWPRPVVVVEADPTGGMGILAGYFQGQVEHTRGLLDLVMAARQDLVAETLPRVLLEIPGTTVRVLPGIRSHAQASGLAGVWRPLLDALRDLESTGQDVLVDAGRLGMEGWPEPLVNGADVTVLVTRSDLPALAAANSWAPVLREVSALAGPTAGLLVVGEGRPYHAREVARTVGLPVFACVEWDEATAAVFSRGAGLPRRPRLLGSLRTAGAALRTVAAQRSTLLTSKGASS